MRLLLMVSLLLFIRWQRCCSAIKLNKCGLRFSMLSNGRNVSVQHQNCRWPIWFNTQYSHILTPFQTFLQFSPSRRFSYIALSFSLIRQILLQLFRALQSQYFCRWFAPFIPAKIAIGRKNKATIK